MTDCPECGAAEGYMHRENCPRSEFGAPYPPRPPEAPKPAPQEKFRLLMGAREQGVVTSVFDLVVEPGFNPAALMQQIIGAGYFMPPSFDVWIPAHMILGVARVRDEKQVTESKVLPFRTIDGGKE